MERADKSRAVGECKAVGRMAVVKGKAGEFGGGGGDRGRGR